MELPRLLMDLISVVQRLEIILLLQMKCGQSMTRSRNGEIEQAIQLRQDRVFGEILLRKHIGFEAIIAEQAAVRDDWR